MPLLHGKGGPQHVCESCSDECVPWEGIFCNDCGNWFHIKCEQLEIQVLQAFKEVPEIPYICKSCRSDERGMFSYILCIQRLHKAAKRGIEQLYIAVERERLLMKENLSYSSTKNTKHTVDPAAIHLLQDYVPDEKRRAIKVSKDNNSLFSAVSVGLCGSEKLATELRVRCCIEMVVYEAYHKWQKNYMQLSECAPEYSESCLNCATPNEDSCVWTMSALASVVRRPIKSVYPAVNGKMDRAVTPLNTTFFPRSKFDDGDEFRVLWSSTQKSEDVTMGSWVPDIFVPLVDVPSVQLSPMVSPFQTPSRSSGRPRKPTPKVMAITGKEKNQLKVVVQEAEDYGNDPDADDPDFDMPSSFSLEAADDAVISKIKYESVDFSWIDKYTHVAHGGKPLKGLSFLPAQQVFTELSTATDVLPSIPTGRKEDVYFVVDNSRNLKFKHRRNIFHDDCGRYNQRTGTTCKSYYLMTPPDKRLVPLIKSKDMYCRESKRVSLGGEATPRRGRGRPRGRGRGRSFGDMPKEDKYTQWIPMDPQPDEDKIILLNRYYSSLEVDPTYRRRISWFVNLPNFVEKGRDVIMVEYLTKPPPGIQLPINRKVITDVNLEDDEDGENQGDDEGEAPEVRDDAGAVEEPEEPGPNGDKADEDGTNEGEEPPEETPEEASENKESEPMDGQTTEQSEPNEEKSKDSPEKSKDVQEKGKQAEEKTKQVQEKTKPAQEKTKQAQEKTQEKTKQAQEKTKQTPAKTKQAEATGDKSGEKTRKRAAASESESETDTGRGKRRKFPSAKVAESASQADFDSDQE